MAEQPEALRLADALENLSRGTRSTMDNAATELRSQHDKIVLLTATLKQVNSQAEHLEREWYLRGDEIERLQELCRGCIKDDTRNGLVDNY
jgi:hypothetical protein